MAKIEWQGISNITSKGFTCGHCGASIASKNGYYSDGSTNQIYICHKCERPNYFNEEGRQYPGSLYGYDVEGISDELVKAMYEEARCCFSVSAYTAAVLCCRKLLMHIAISKNADENKSFVYYVEYLRDNHYVPPDASSWVDHIRQKDNEANHEIVMISKEEAEQLINFVGILLKVIYEFPSLVNSAD